MRRFYVQYVIASDSWEVSSEDQEHIRGIRSRPMNIWRETERRLVCVQQWIMKWGLMQIDWDRLKCSDCKLRKCVTVLKVIVVTTCEWLIKPITNPDSVSSRPNTLQYYHPTYALVSQVVCSLQVLQPKCSVPFSSPHAHICPTHLSLVDLITPTTLAKRTNYDVPRCTIFSIVLRLPLSYVQIP
jgi:hypothetical protein